MISHIDVLACALVGVVLWVGVGLALARRLPLGRDLTLALAPLVGWAAQNAIGLPVAMIFGFSAVTVAGATALVVLLTAFIASPARADERRPGMPPWVFAAAAILAIAPALSVLPKISGDGVLLSASMFDHSKIALIDEMLRAGVPPGNPFVGDAGSQGGVAYYYLWHFGAAQTAMLAGTGGWAADAASTWFTAFSTLLLVAGLAFHFGRNSLAPACALLISLCGSLRPVLGAAFGEEALRQALEPATGLAGWLFQITWSPHHVMSAGCLVVAVLLAAQLARRTTLPLTATFAWLLAAAFASSIWVGGVVAALALLVAGLRLLPVTEPGRRMRFILSCLSVAAIAAAMVSPLLVEQARLAGLRGGGLPVGFDAFHVLGPAFPDPLRRVLDLPAYWLILLPVELPGAVLPLLIVLRRWGRGRKFAVGDDPWTGPLSLLAMISLGCGWLLVSTVGPNNDLGWRAILPAVMLLTVAASVLLGHWLSDRAPLRSGMALAAVVLGLPQSADIVIGNALGDPSPQGHVFAQSPAMWEAVRRHAGLQERVANNPLFLQAITPWPVNISWALLANRRSCFAGRELAIAFAPLSPARRDEVSAQFIRVFSGNAISGDVEALATQHRCDVVLLTPLDGAWARDPFTGRTEYRLVEAEKDRWRIYRVVR